MAKSNLKRPKKLQNATLPETHQLLNYICREDLEFISLYFLFHPLTDLSIQAEDKGHIVEMNRLGEKNRDSNYEAILLQSIDKALLTLGENVRLSIYFHLQTKFGLPRHEIPSRPAEFSDALGTIFGEASKKIEIIIIKFLNEKVQCSYEWTGPDWLVPNLTFEGYLKMVKATVENKKAQSNVPLSEGEDFG